jgi:putative membrane protein
VGALVLQLSPAVVFGVLYAVRARTLAAHGRPVEVWRVVSWYTGLVIIIAVLASPLATLADTRFSAHMAEHLLIADIAALLLVLGLTGPLLAPLLRNPLLGPLRHLAHPVPALLLWALDLAFWHLPGPQEAAVNHDAVHALQHMMFIGFGVNMWMALLGPLPKPSWFGNLACLGYIVGVRLFGTVLANVFVWADHPLYDVYGGGTQDQVIAGSIMMVEGSLLTLGLGCWLFLRAARQGEERLELIEFAQARGVPLDERRAARAVAAGRGEELRRRLEAGSS